MPTEDYLLDLQNTNILPALDKSRLPGMTFNGHAPRILMLYGSLRARSYSRLALEEAARILLYLGADVRIFNPSSLPLPNDDTDSDHPAVRALRDLSIWSEGHVWCSPERHGNITGVMKTQIDHLPLTMNGIRLTQNRTLAVMQVSGGSQSFNTVNTLRILGRWMRMLTIPNQSSIAMAYKEFDEAGRMLPSNYYARIVDVMEELMHVTLWLRSQKNTLGNRYSERCKAGIQKQGTS